jgi:hypothetical protein
LQSSAPIIDLDDDDDAVPSPNAVPSPTWYIAPAASSKSHTVSPVWNYFGYFDVGRHPGMKYYRICLVCFGKQIQKKINCTKHYTPTPLVNHLRQAHKEQYEEYLILANEMKNKGKGTTSASMKSITDHFPLITTTKENFNRKYAKWIVANNMPLYTGESSEFKEMIRSLNQAVNSPDHRATIDMLTVKKLQAMAKLNFRESANASGKIFFVG